MSAAADAFSLPADIRAAILWDVPALRRSGPGAANFLKAFGPPPWDLDDGASGPLNDAAEAVVAAAYSRTADALAISAALASAAEPAAQLLGRVLTAWFWEAYPERSARVFAAIELAHGVVDRTERARVLRKLAIWAFETDARDVARDAANAALEAADPHSRLAWALRGLLDALGGGGTGWTAESLPEDELITLPWISDLAFGATVEADLLRFQAGLAGAWGGSVRLGQTPQDVLNAAQRQADWAGATSMRDTLLRLLCSQLLDGAARSDAQIQWAASTWVLAGGDHISTVLQRAERSLTSATANDLLDAVERHPFVRERFPQVAMGIWRHVGEDQVGRLLDALDPGEPGQVVNAEARHLWAVLLWRDPDLWYDKWLRLDMRRRQGAMALLTPVSVDHLPAQAAPELLAAIEDVTDPRAFVTISAALAIAEGVDPRRWLDHARPDEILELADWRRDAIPNDVIARNIDVAQANVEAERQEAIDGTFSLGGTNPSKALGGLVARLRRPNKSAERLLIDVAADSRLSSEAQIQAFQGLVHMRHEDLLSEQGRRRLRELPDELGRDIWGVIDTTVLRAARLWAYADELTRAELGEIVAACRSPKQETRIIALATIEDYLRAKPKNATAAWALVGALYDPSDDVLTRALEIVGRGALKPHPDAAATGLTGVISAYRTGRNRVRVTAVWAARAFDKKPEARALIDAARADPSWEVRYAVERSAAQESTLAGR